MTNPIHFIHLKNCEQKKTENGFTLLEFVIAMGIFVTVSGAAFMLFNRQQTTFLRQQGQVGINIALRNASSQIQMDVSNAGTANYPAANLSGWPVGVTIVNNVVATNSSCYNTTTFAYTANCYDVLNVIAGADPAVTPPINSTDNSGVNGPGNCSDTSTGIAYGQGGANAAAATTTAGLYKSGDQLLLLTYGSTFGNSGAQGGQNQKMTSVVLTANPTVVAGTTAVRFTFNATNANGTNTLTNDPLDITACDNLTCPTPNNFGNSFCGGDWIIKLAPITYKVDSSNSADPILTRTVKGGTPSTVMEQIIGFKVGATIWNNATDVVSTQYNYDASCYANNQGCDATHATGDQAWNFTVVRSLRISLIGRTAPNTNPTYTFRNLFDHGPYQVEGLALVVNPRNLSMND